MYITRLKKLRDNQIFQGLLDTGCVLTVIPEEPEHHNGPPHRVGAYGGLVINGVSDQVHLTEGLVDP